MRLSKVVGYTAGVVIGTHLGRPNGFDKKLSLSPVAKRLAKLIERPVYLHEDVTNADHSAAGISYIVKINNHVYASSSGDADAAIS